MNKLISKLLTRFRHSDLGVIFDNWSVLKSRRIDRSGFPETKSVAAKKKFIKTVLELTEKKPVTYSEAAELYLLYISHWPACKKWFVHRLNSKKGNLPPVGFTPAGLKKRLRKEFNLYSLQTTVAVHCKDGGFWVCIDFNSESGSRLSNMRNATCIVWYPCTQYLGISNMPAKYRGFIVEVLSTVFGCQTVEKMDLEGRCVKSLLRLALYQSRQNLPNGLHDAGDGVPDDVANNGGSCEELDNRIENENMQETLRRRNYVSSSLGEGPQPKLEFLEYKLETKFAGTTHAPAMADFERFRCGVRFEGTNVLEGIKELVSAGIAHHPLPNHLANVKSLARNKFLIRSKTDGGHSGGTRNASQTKSGQKNSSEGGKG